MLKYSSGTLYTMSVFMREEPELGGAEISFWAGLVCEASTQFIFIEILWGFIEIFYIIFVHLPVTPTLECFTEQKQEEVVMLRMIKSDEF